MSIEAIKNNEVFKQVISDSCGGVLYNVANYGKYDTTELLALWDSLSDSERASAGGIVKGAMNFLNKQPVDLK